MRSAASVDAATSTIEAIDAAVDGVHHETWHQGDPSGGALSCWTASDEDEDGVAIEIDLIVEAPLGGLSHVCIHVERGTATSDATVVCAPALVEHLFEVPTALMRFVSGLLSDAIGTEDAMPAARPSRTGHADLDPEGARMLVAQADRHDMDPSKGIRIDTWGPCPLSPSTIMTTGSGRRVVEIMDDEVATAVRLSVNPSGAVTLEPLVETLQSDGFDAMELLKIHRASSAGIAA
jgi:hypothetical protein